MKKILLLVVLSITLLNCNYIEDNRKERLRNDSIQKVKIDSIRTDSLIRDSIDKHIKDSIKSKIWVDKIKNSIKVTGCYLGEANSVGGRDLYFHYTNKSKKVIKYVIFDAGIINSVGDCIDVYRGRDTGPLKPNKNSNDGSYWECVTYDYSARNVYIARIDVEYMDGSKITIQGSGLSLIGLK